MAWSHGAAGELMASELRGVPLSLPSVAVGRRLLIHALERDDGAAHLALY